MLERLNVTTASLQPNPSDGMMEPLSASLTYLMARLLGEESLIDNDKLANCLRQFASDRDWDQFHTPKNLASALTVESSELLEIFQWSRGQTGWSDLQSPEIRSRTEEELADILLYLIRFADRAGIDLQSSAETKLALNEQKYPVEKFKGSDRKYDE